MIYKSCLCFFFVFLRKYTFHSLWLSTVFQSCYFWIFSKFKFSYNKLSTSRLISIHDIQPCPLAFSYQTLYRSHCVVKSFFNSAKIAPFQRFHPWPSNLVTAFLAHIIIGLTTSSSFSFWPLLLTEIMFFICLHC